MNFVWRVDGFAFDDGCTDIEVSFQFFSDLLCSDTERSDMGASTFSAGFGKVILGFADVAESDEFSV
jgi:hypothetical protein